MLPDYSQREFEIAFIPGLMFELSSECAQVFILGLQNNRKTKSSWI